MSKNPPKGELAILESLYGLYKSNLENKEILEHINTVAWELTFSLNADGVFHNLAELVQGTLRAGIMPNPDDHYVQEIERTLDSMNADPKNFY